MSECKGGDGWGCLEFILLVCLTMATCSMREDVEDIRDAIVGASAADTTAQPNDSETNEAQP